MIYSEAAYFDGNHCQHVADKIEHDRIRRAQRQGEEAMRRYRRRTGSRAAFPFA